MGKYSKSLDMLFVSKVRIKALRYFLYHPKDSIHLRGAVREFQEEINAVRRELLRLAEMDLLKEESAGNRKYFSLNTTHPFIDELMAIFHKSFGIGSALIENQKKLGAIDYAFLTPAFTKGVYYGDMAIDLAVIGAVDLEALSGIVKEFEDDLGREIHYSVMKPSEFQIRRRRRDDFILNMMIQNLIMLIGSKEELIKDR